MRVLVVPLPGKCAKDPFGQVVPDDGRYYPYGPHWIRAQKRSLVKIVKPGEIPVGEMQFKKRGKR